MSGFQKCDILEPILMVVKKTNPAFEPIISSFSKHLKGKANTEISSLIQMLLGSCVVQSLFTWMVMKMGEISINHKLLEQCCQTGKSCRVVMALIMQLMLTDIFSFYSVCKDVSSKYLPGYLFS